MVEIVKVTYPDGRTGEMYIGGGGGPGTGHGATGGNGSVGDVILMGAGGGAGGPAAPPRPVPPVHEEEQVALIEIRIKAGSRLTPEAVMDAAEDEMGGRCTDLDWRVIHATP